MEAAINLDFIANYGVFLDAECSKSVRLRLFLESRCYCSAWCRLISASLRGELITLSYQIDTNGSTNNGALDLDKAMLRLLSTRPIPSVALPNMAFSGLYVKLEDAARHIYQLKIIVFGLS